MNRRTFLVSAFILGVNAALGNRLKAVAPVIPLDRANGLLYFDGTNDYLKTAPFKMDGHATVWLFNEAHTADQQDAVVEWINSGARIPCPIPGLVMRPVPSC